MTLKSSKEKKKKRKKIGFLSRIEPCSINELKIDSVTFTEASDLCEILNDHFTHIGTNLASSIPDSENSFQSYINPVNSTFSLKPTSVNVILKHLGKLPIHKATGLDNISGRLLKEAAPVISASLTIIINRSIETGLFPSAWKTAKVFPLFKANDRSDPNNYRPISVLPVISKICERIVYDQLYSYLIEHNLLTKYQSGFRSLHSTVTALLDVTNEWQLNIDKGLTNLVIFHLDLAKAFVFAPCVYNC